jgi:hypothetical protein
MRKTIFIAVLSVSVLVSMIFWMILRKGAATSYYVSIYMWLAFMFFEEYIDLERRTLIGAGILGMALIYALSWFYHNYIRRSHD